MSIEYKKDEDSNHFEPMSLYSRVSFIGQTDEVIDGAGLIFCPYTLEVVDDQNYTPDPDYIKFMRDYDDAHKYCPRCGDAGNYRITLVAFGFHKDSEYQDKNDCVCHKCGSRHIKHERTSESIVNYDIEAFQVEYNLNHILCPKCSNHDFEIVVDAAYPCFDYRDYKNISLCKCSKCHDEHSFNDRLPLSKI